MRKIFAILLMLLLCAFIFFLTQSLHFTNDNTMKEISSLLSSSDVDAVLMNTILRKGAHFFLFGSLAVLLKIIINPRRRSDLLAWLGATLYGIGDEFHQSLVPGRGALVTDVIIDSAGACTGLLLYFLWDQQRKRKARIKGISKRKA